MKKTNDLDPKLREALEALKSVPARDPGNTAQGRARFLQEASSLRYAQKMSVKTRVVHRWRLGVNAFAFVIILLLLFFGWSGGAVYAAQDALPGQFLYPLKLWSEDTWLDLESTPDTKIDLLMQFVQRRVTEMNALAAQGSDIPTKTPERTEQQISLALELAATMNDDSMQAALLRIRTQLENQGQLLEEDGLELVRNVFQTQIQIVDDGLQDPEAFRNTFRNQGQAEATFTQTPTTQSTLTPEALPTGDGAGEERTPTISEFHSPTMSPQPPEHTPGPSQETGGQSTPGGQGNGNGGKP